MSWKNWIPKVVWKKDATIREENENLIALCEQVHEINSGLNQAVGNVYAQALSVKKEAQTLLTALAFQHNGSFVIKADFFNVLQDPTNADLTVQIEKQEDGSVLVKLVKVKPEETEDAS